MLDTFGMLPTGHTNISAFSWMEQRPNRHLWIGNLCENVREEEIRDLFQRHGRIQSVKLLEEVNSNNGGRPGKSATIAFIDIRSASKALRNVRTVAGQPIHISYYEPGSAPPPSFPPHNSHGEASVNSSETLVSPSQGNPSSNATTNNNVVVTNNCIPSTPGPGMYRQRFSGGLHGQSEDSSSHFYDQPKSFRGGRGDEGFHGSRGRRENRPPFHSRHSFPADNRNYRSQWNYHHPEGRYAPPVHADEERPSIPSPVVHTPPSESGPNKPPRRAESPASSVSSRHLISKRRRSRSVSNSGSSDRGSSVGSRSRSGSRSSVSTSVSSSRSRSPSHHGNFPRSTGSNNNNTTDRFHHSSHSRHRYSRSRVLTTTRASDSRVRHNSRSPLAASPSSSASSSPSPHRKISANSPSHSPSSSKSYSPSRNAGGSQHHNNHHHHRRASSVELLAAIKIRNLPIRSSDTSLKDGLYHEYKKHGKVAWVRVNGTGPDRFAIVCFKSAEHATRAVSVSQGKLFFGCKIQVTPYKHAKGEDIIGGQDEENRLLVEDEPTSVGYPTRTVLITGLDATVTSAELQAVFDQYGDIVRLDIRKQGTATHAVCEFVDIASAIRAQWGRHVFKSKEARISFFRNPPSNALILDGTAGVNEKQVYGQCCQYGAIKEIVMDPERVLAVVQFQEISEAQTAIRQLRSWVIKGKRLQVDFASNDVIRRVVQRVTGVTPSPVGNSSPGLISSPSIGNSIIPLHDTINIGRKMSKQEEEEDDDNDGIYNIPEDSDSYIRVSKTDRNLRRIVPSSKSQLASINSEMDGTVGYASDKAPYSIRPYTSPVSPDADHSSSLAGQPTPNSSVRSSNTTSKIDFNCHETDSAVVTSSSDIVVGDKSEVHSNSGMNFDDKLGYTESEVHGSLDTSHGALTFVDGVSSTSPEPKPETVRKASPDSAVSHSISSRSSSIESRSFFKGVADPRRQPNNLKIRRSSADSGNNVGTVSSYMHSTSSSLTNTPSHPPASTTDSNTQVVDEESDDRPGTPLCDENPESFSSSSEVPVVTPSSKSSSFTLNTKMDPISLPLPEFALQSQRHRTNSNTSSSKEFPTSSVRVDRCSIESDANKSPVMSPSLHVTNSPTEMEVDTASSLVSMDEATVSPTTSSSVWKDESDQITSPTVPGGHSNDSPPTFEESPLHEFEEQHLSANSVPDSASLNQDKVIGSPESDDTGMSPKNSPTDSVSLEQRILKCCETYDRFNGGKPSASESSDIFNDSSTTCVLSHTLKSGSSTDSSSDSPSSRFKFLDWTELMQRPSDIGKSVLARKSVFDEDSKRLENFEEKYEAKGSSTPTSSTTWRAIALQRSLSVSSSSSSNNWHFPHTPVPGASSSSSPSSTHPIHIPASLVGTTTSSSRSHDRVSVIPTSLNNFNPKITPSLSSSVFQSSAQPKPKDLHTLSSSSITSSKPVKLEAVPTTKNHPPPSPHLTSQSSLQTTSFPHKLTFPKANIEPPKSPSAKTSDVKDTNERSQAVVNSSIPPITPVTPLPQLTSREEILSLEKASSAVFSSPLTIPRSVERSISLDSNKKVTTNNPRSWGQAPSVTTLAVSDNESSKGAHRRSSIDSSSSLAPKSKSLLQSGETSGLSSTKVKSEVLTPCSVSTSSLSSTTSLLPADNKTSKELHKPDLELLKRDISGIRPIHQETTVGVVAAEQITFIPSRSDSVSSTSTRDSSSRKEKEKKRRSSGTSPPVSSLPPPSNTLLHVARPETLQPTTTPHQASSRDNISSVKKVDDKKEKKDRGSESKLSSSNNSSSTTNVEQLDKDDGSRKSGDNNKDKDKRDCKKEKHSHKDSTTEHPRSSLNESSHHHQQSHHRRDKESSTSTKRKRDNSGNEGEREMEQKKGKLEKEVHDVTLHRLKAASTNERRESRDSSSSNKDRHKEASSKDGSSRPSSSSISLPTEVPLKDNKKEDSKSKENHYRSSKEKSSSSKDRHYDKARTSSENRSSVHQPSKSDYSSNKDKDRSKKDRGVSPGKENVKGSSSSSSRHHTHSSSSHRSSTSSKKESTSSTSSKPSTSHDDKTKRSHTDKHNNSIDSDSCGEYSATTTTAKCENSDSQSRSKCSKSQSKSSRSDKSRDSNEKWERHRSGDSTTHASTSGAGGDSESRKKNRDQKKKKKFVVEETDSDSDSDDEDKKKHHSIFEVVIDEYVSMYDKVKARSNRACKAQPHQPQVVDEVKKKEDKIKDQFRALKQSRAKKIEKKRSTSVDESNKSGVHTSSDEETLRMPSTDVSTHVHSELSHDINRELRRTSDEEEHEDEDDDTHNESSRSKSSKKMKSKKKSSMEKLLKRRGKKLGKSPPKSYQRSMESVFTNSECESNASSHNAEPQRKKKKIATSKLSFPDVNVSQEFKSSGDSMSDSGSVDESPKHNKKGDTIKALGKLQTVDVYSSDSDSSVQSGPVRRPTPPVIKSSSGKSKSKEKLSKQKSMKKSLFSSDSSEEDKRPPPPPHDATRKDKKETQRSKSRERGESNKSSHKKHRGHSSVSKSGKSGKSRVGSGDGSVEIDSASLTIIGKRESTSTMKDILFGPMSASSGSENDDQVLHLSDHAPPTRPKTPTIAAHESPPRKMSDIILHSPRKSKAMPPADERKYPRSISPCSNSLDLQTGLQTSDNLDLEKLDSKLPTEKNNSERRRRRHHKDKKSKRTDSDEQHHSNAKNYSKSGTSSETSSVNTKPDLDSLFNSPRVSPCKEYMSPRIKQESISETPSAQFLETQVPTSSPIKNNFESLSVTGEVTRSMFSSDEDDDDDKLKIDINEAIIASSDEPGMDIRDTLISNDKRIREEEEKQMNSLFEQDKAIESIVLLDRKSPPVTCPVPDDDPVKYDPKDGTAISQEETEDAVAALLETLEGDDSIEETGPVKQQSAVVTTAPSTTVVTPSVSSPPTLRIIEEQAPSFVSTSEVNVLAPHSAENKQRITSPIAWSSLEHPPASSSSIDNNKGEKPNIQTTPEAIVSRKSSLDSISGNTEEVKNSIISLELPSPSVPLRRTSCSTKSRQGSSERENDENNENSSADIYEFHDSDDETSEKKKGLVPHAKLSPITVLEFAIKSPLTSPPVTVANPEVKSPLVSPNSTSAAVAAGGHSPALPPLSVTTDQQQITVVAPPSSSIVVPPQPTVVPPTVITPKPFTPITPVSADPFIIRPTIMTPPLASGSKTPPAPCPLPPPIRNKVDDTIEHVIRMAVQSEDTFFCTPPVSSADNVVTITTIKANARGRSRSRDSATEETSNSSSNGGSGPVSITRVLHRPETVISTTPPHLPSMSPSSVVSTGPSSAHHHPAVDTPPQVIKCEVETGPLLKDDATETLIDPQTGILMPMIRQSEEGQYVPILGQESSNLGGLPKVQQPQFSVPCFQKEHDVILPKSEEKPQIANHPANIQKSEGLAATMFSHPQVFQVSGQNQYVIPQNVAGAKVIPHQPRFQSVMPGHRLALPPEASAATIYMTKPPTQYTGPNNLPQIPTHTGMRMPSSSNNNSTGRSSQEFGHKGVSHDSIPVSISHLGAGPMIRAIFPPGVPQLLQSGQYQYAVISKAELPPAQSSRLQGANLQQQIPPMMQNIAKYGAPNVSHGQGEIKNFQIPSATTITKVNTGQEEAMQRKNIIMTSQPSIMLSSPVTSLRSVSPNVMNTKTYMSATPSMSMTRQQQQQHHAQTELFHKSAEGLIRVAPKDEQQIHGVKNMHSASAEIVQPPRVEINVNAHAVASAQSPKGRITAHDQYQSLSSSMPQYTLKSGEVRILPTPNTSIPDHHHLSFIQQREYANYNVPAGSPPTSSHGPIMRSGGVGGMSEKTDFNKLNPMMAAHERNRMAAQQNMQHSMSPHSMEPRNSESPVVSSMYAPSVHGKQPMYQPPTPAHQLQGVPRQDNFKNVYADQMERQQHANSPSYPPSFDPRVGVPNMVPPDRERVLSPYAIREGVLQQRAPYSPPPAHGRYSIPPSQGAEGHNNERQQRIMNTQTPPHIISQVPPQGDTLLMLLQRYPIMWQGLLTLKNDNAACQMHFVSGNLDVARESLPANPDGSVPPLRISQRMRLEEAQLQGVATKMQMEPEHCILLALPCGRDQVDVLQQSNNLRHGFITYLQLKQAAGIINIGHQNQATFVIHIFPSCDFANENLARIAPDLLHGVADIAHLLIVIATV